MREVKIKKHDLIGKIRENRKEHKEIFETARAVYLNKATALMKHLVEKEASWEDWTREFRTLLRLRVPENHVKEYDRALAMLDMEVGDIITLSAQDFAQLVQDEWHWSKDWAVSNSAYVDNPKLRALTALDE